MAENEELQSSSLLLLRKVQSKVTAHDRRTRVSISVTSVWTLCNVSLT